MDLLELILKLVLAVALGGLVGIEREASQKPAGFRTNILVCLGSTVLMSLAVGLFQNGQAAPDTLVRMAAGVVAGIGFLGAGTIIHARGMVIGLTTASTLWVVAGLGLVIGAGYYVPALIITAVVIATLVAFRKIEEMYLRKHIFHYHLKFHDSPEILSNLKKISFHHGVKLERLSLRKEGNFLVISFSISGPEEKEQEFNDSIMNLNGLEEFKVD
ncbi:MAG: MgtC/SapB family protein [Candidatus Aminicenantes bacterium]|nr:MgtC/SapB family protein [Candidatus Aminicenantes bacterium]